MFVVASLTILLTEFPELAAAPPLADFTVLRTFLSRSSTSLKSDLGFQAWLCVEYGVDRQSDWPVAPLLASLARSQNNSRYWICAQPVQLLVDRDSLVLSPVSALKLSEDESTRLFQTVRDHLASDNLEMCFIDEMHWCIGCSHPQALQTTEPSRVAGNQIDGFLPSGNDAGWWQQKLTEVQMLLHAHPVNLEREQRGELTANSLWLWGGGSQPMTPRRYDAIHGLHPIARAFALLSGVESLTKPFAVAKRTANENILVVIEPGGQTAEEYLTEIESDWLDPAWRALSERQLDEIRCVVPTPRGMVETVCDTRARRRFWRRRLPLAEYLDRMRAHS